MNILIYFPYNLRSVEQQSVMEMLLNKGHQVFFLSTCKKGFLHHYLEGLGVRTGATPLPDDVSKLRFYISNIRRFTSFVKENKIDVVIAHQQLPALFAGIVRRFYDFNLMYVRHNSDEDYQLSPLKAKWLNKLANLLTPIKIAPSSVVEKFWMETERAPRQQIRRINYGYNFDHYEKPDLNRVEEIKAEFQTSFLILSIARLSPTKRHPLMFDIIVKLVNQGVDCRFICLGSGPDQAALNDRIATLGMQDRIFLLGRRENVFDYIKAADVFLHLSSSEASNSAVKEVGLCKKPVIVCKGVGDFEDYIVNGINGFLVEKDNPADEAYKILLDISNSTAKKDTIGNKLFETVTTTFDIKNVAPKYEELLNQMMRPK